MSNLIDRRNGKPFYATFERHYEAPLPRPLTLLKWGVLLVVLAAVLLLAIAGQP